MPKPPPVPELGAPKSGVLRLQSAERRYKAVRRAARWSMGPVYTGEVLPDRAPCTIVFPEVVGGDVEELLAGVEREIRARDVLAGLPVLSFLYAGQTVERRAFLVLPPALGRTLGDKVEADGPLKPAAALQVAVVVADALVRLHARGRCLGELRPESVLLPEDRSQPLRMIDLGVARGLFARCIAPPLPEPGYSSPRVRAGAYPDARDDVHALGALLRFLLTGRPPSERLPSRERPLGPFAAFLDGVVVAALSATETPAGGQFPDMLQLARSLRGLRDLHRLSPQARRTILSLLPERPGTRPPPVPGRPAAHEEALDFVETDSGAAPEPPALLSEEALQSIETASIHDADQLDED
jgi:serine/threonine protein kinase